MIRTWDNNLRAFADAPTPRTWNTSLGAYQDSEGRAYSHGSEAWETVWPDGVKAYVYGAANEVVTIKKNGITVAAVNTNADGCSNEQIQLGNGIYTLTGSVSGWTETQEIGRGTDKIRAMPEGALYWYGNECSDITGGWVVDGYSAAVIKEGQKSLNNFFGRGSGVGFGTNNPVPMEGYSGINFDCKGTAVFYENNISLEVLLRSRKDGGLTDYNVVPKKGILGTLRQTANFDVSQVSQPIYIVAASGYNPACGGCYHAIWAE